MRSSLPKAVRYDRTESYRPLDIHYVAPLDTLHGGTAGLVVVDLTGVKESVGWLLFSLGSLQMTSRKSMQGSPGDTDPRGPPRGHDGFRKSKAAAMMSGRLDLWFAGIGQPSSPRLQKRLMLRR